MLGQYFYNESLRKTIIAFGSLFMIFKYRKDSSGEEIQTMKVPLAMVQSRSLLPDLHKIPVQLNRLH